MPKEKTSKEKTPKGKTPKGIIVTLPAYLEPDRLLLEKVAGKIGEYRIYSGYKDCECKCTCSFTDPGPIIMTDIKELDAKIKKLADLVNTKFGEISKILSNLKK
jgi:hypothetical protein